MTMKMFGLLVCLPAQDGMIMYKQHSRGRYRSKTHNNHPVKSHRYSSAEASRLHSDPSSQEHTLTEIHASTSIREHHHQHQQKETNRVSGSGIQRTEDLE